MKLCNYFLLIFCLIISYQSMFSSLPSGVASAHSYRGKNVFNMTAQLYGPGSTNVPDPVTVPHGGTGDTTLTQYGVLIGEGTNPVQVTAAGTTGTVLIGTTGANPSFSPNIVVSNIATTTGTITSAPVSNDDIVNKAYVDLFVAGLTVKAACVAATTAALTVTCSGTGVGSTLTNAGAMAAFSLDGVSPTVGQRVLIKDQASQQQNGVYTVTTVGSGAVNWVLTRATDFDTPAEVFPGVIVPVTSGTVNANTLWLETATVATVGCAGDPIVFAVFLEPGIQTLNGDTGSATGSTITIAGGTGITTSASGTTVTIDLDVPVTVANGGTGVTTMTTAYAPVCAGTTATGALQVASTGLSTANYVLTSNGAGAVPSFQDVSAAGAIKTITGNTGGALSGSNINIVGGTTGLSFSGAGTTETLTGTLIVGNGGTGVATLTQYAVLIGEGTAAIQSASPSATSGVPLVSQGAAANPAFGTAVVAGGGTGVTSLTAYALIAGGTTSTGAVQSLTTGTSGQILQSNGSAALPTWVDGSTVGFQTTTTTLTNAQIKALRATPIQIVAAPGSGKVINVLNCTVKLNYGGTSAFTAAASQTLGLSYTTTPTTGVSIIAAVASNALITSTSTQVLGTINGGQDLTAYTNINNQPVYIFNTVATEISGNAANDNTMTVVTTYQTLTI